MSLALAEKENVEDIKARNKEGIEEVLKAYPDNIAGQAKAKVARSIRTQGEK
jgi:dihydroorotase